MSEEEYNQLQYDIEEQQLMNIEKKKKQIAGGRLCPLGAGRGRRGWPARGGVIDCY